MNIDVEKLSHRRSSADVIFAISYLGLTLPLWDWFQPLDSKGFGWIDFVQLISWFGFMWGWLTLRAVRKATNKSPIEAAALFDELVQSKKKRAVVFSFNVVLLTSAVLMLANIELFKGLNFNLTAKDTAQLIFTSGLISVLLARAYLERSNG